MSFLQYFIVTILPGTENLLLSWFHVRSATFSPHADVVKRSMMCTWDESCRAAENSKVDRVFTEYHETYSQGILSVKKRFKEFAPSWDLGPDFDGTQNVSRLMLQEQASTIAAANKAVFNSHIASLKSLIASIQTSNITSEGALELNHESLLIYHSVTTFNCLAFPIILGIGMKIIGHLAFGINVMELNNVRRFFISLCVFSALFVLFDSKFTILLPYYVSQTCFDLSQTLSKLQLSFGLYDTSDFFDKNLKFCPLVTKKYDHFNHKANGFGNAPLILQLHKVFSSLMHTLRSMMGFWDNGEVFMSFFVGYQVIYYRFSKYIDRGLGKLSCFVKRVALGDDDHCAQ
jgi:hypothetical protein